MDRPKVSIVIPVYNEQDSIAALHGRLVGALEPACEDFELIFVDDGSVDESAARVAEARRSDGRVRLVEFSRNFGKEMAILAGYDHARGRAVVVMDADLQTPPEVLPQMIEKWQAGCDIVDALRVDTRGQGFFRRSASRMFYWLIQKVSSTRIIPNCVDFRLMDRKVVDHLRRCRERFRFNRGLVSWVGFRRCSVEFVADERTAGASRWGFWTLLKYALDAIFSFSSAPLRMAGVLGLIVSILSFLYLIVLVIDRMVRGQPMPGYATVVGGIFLLGGVQLLTIWVLGEYVGRIYEQGQRRPLYIVKRTLDAPGAEGDADSGEEPSRDEADPPSETEGESP